MAKTEKPKQSRYKIQFFNNEEKCNSIAINDRSYHSKL